MAILIFLLLHWYLSLFGQTFYLHRYAAHKMFTMSPFWEKFWYLFTSVALERMNWYEEILTLVW